jgi:hypothetical protein
MHYLPDDPFPALKGWVKFIRPLRGQLRNRGLYLDIFELNSTPDQEVWFRGKEEIADHLSPMWSEK